MRCISYDFEGGYDCENLKDEKGRKVFNIKNYYES
jgi:hypothetical protein